MLLHWGAIMLSPIFHGSKALSMLDEEQTLRCLSSRGCEPGTALGTFLTALNGAYNAGGVSIPYRQAFRGPCACDLFMCPPLMSSHLKLAV